MAEVKIVSMDGLGYGVVRYADGTAKVRAFRERYFGCLDFEFLTPAEARERAQKHYDALMRWADEAEKP